jgi:hypothetical protein
MLSAQMNAMRPGDKYDVLSDFTSWSATRLKLLFEANGDRSMKGIMSRRIFCIFDHDYRLASDTVIQVMTDHWQQARRVGSNYQVGFITTRGNWKHQGNFMHGDKCIRFEPDDKLEVFEFFRLTTHENDDSLPAKAWRKVELDSARHTEDDLQLLCARVHALWADPPDIS